MLGLIGSVAGGLLGAVGSGSAANAQASAAREAAQIQADATNRSLDLQERIYNDSTRRFQPYLREGRNALAQYSELVSQPTEVTPLTAYSAFDERAFADNYRASPGYDFRLNEGLKATEASSAMRHGLTSGATLKALNNYAQGVADQAYTTDRAFAAGEHNSDRAYRTSIDGTNQATALAARSDDLNRLYGLAGMGQAAAGQQAAVGTNYASQASNALAQGANAAAGGLVNAANATAAGTIGVTNALNTGIQNGIGAWQYQNALNMGA